MDEDFRQRGVQGSGGGLGLFVFERVYGFVYLYRESFLLGQFLVRFFRQQDVGTRVVYYQEVLLLRFRYVVYIGFDGLCIRWLLFFFRKVVSEVVVVVFGVFFFSGVLGRLLVCVKSIFSRFIVWRGRGYKFGSRDQGTRLQRGEYFVYSIGVLFEILLSFNRFFKNRERKGNFQSC